MNLDTLFSEERFITAVVNSSAGRFAAVPIRVSQSPEARSIYAVAQRLRLGRRALLLGPYGLYASPGMPWAASPESLDFMVRQLKGLGTDRFIWNVRFDHEPLAQGLASLGLQFRQTTTHVLRLNAGYDAVFSGYTETVRNQVRRTKCQGLVVREASNPNDIRSYYALHIKLAAQKPGFSLRYAIELFLTLAELTTDVRILLAEIDGRVAAGGVFFRDGTSMSYWHGAADREYSRQFPTCAVVDHAIQMACAGKMETVNFGASNGIASLEQFKGFWGARPEKCWHFSWDNPLWKTLKGVKERLLSHG